MPKPRLVVHPTGLDAKFQLLPEDDEEEEGQIIDDDDDDDDDEADEDHGMMRGHKGDSITASPNGNHNECENADETRSQNGCDKTGSKASSPRISLFEMQSFLIALLLPEPRLSNPPTWCKVVRCMRASNVGIFLLDHNEIDWIPDKGSKFEHGFKFETTPNWIEQLTNVPLSSRQKDLTVPIEMGAAKGRIETNLNAPPKIPKTSLLLSPVQMLVENYPMPYEDHISVLTSKYLPVEETSPMFAIDCEMCVTDKSELTRISIVDEELRVVYNELVKPEKPITNYLTRYSGITESMLEGVKTSLKDVQKFMSEYLPRDSIFCGHSLNSDLAAIEIFHPYVIDTSVIFNLTGTRSHKPSLKSLAYELLGKEIQSFDKLGHDSLEDAITTMELVRLKLVNGTVFADTVAYDHSQGIKYDARTGITHLQINNFIDRHKVLSLSYRSIDTTPGARCLYVHDKPEPLGQELKDAIMHLLNQESAICVILTNAGECYVKF